MMFLALSSFIVLGCDKGEEEEPNTNTNVQQEENKEENKEEEKDPVLGCMNPESINYNPQATEDDGSCKFAAEENTIVLVDVSATWCGPCGSYGIPAFNMVYDEMHDESVMINLQTNRSDLANSASLSLSNYVFSTRSIPMFFANHEAFSVKNPLEANVTACKDYAAKFANEPVVAGLYGEYTKEGTNDYTATIWSKFYQPAEGIYRLGVYVMENGIKAYQNGIGPDHIHDHLLQGAITGNLGTSLSKTSFEEGELVKSEFSKSVNGIQNIDNTYVIAILFKANSGTDLEIVNSFTLKEAAE